MNTTTLTPRRETAASQRRQHVPSHLLHPPEDCAEGVIGQYQPIKISKRKGLRALICFMMLVLVAACAPQAVENTTTDATEGVVAENLPPVEQTQVMVTAEGETQLYSDAELGFAFEYPTTWNIQATQGSSVVLVSFPVTATGDQTAEPIPSAIPEGGSRIDFAPMADTIDTLDAGVQAVRDAIAQSGETVASDQEVRLADNTPAYRIASASSTGDTREVLVTAINDHVLVFTSQGDPVGLDLIQSTLRDAA